MPDLRKKERKNELRRFILPNTAAKYKFHKVNCAGRLMSLDG